LKATGNICRIEPIDEGTDGDDERDRGKFLKCN
jgi:hypothetical protein